jgi:hypothetical protein
VGASNGTSLSIVKITEAGIGMFDARVGRALEWH